MTAAATTTSSAFARGRLGRRIVAQFMVAVCVPLAVLAGLAYQALRAQTEAYDQRQLDAGVGNDAMRVFDRLLAARAALRLDPNPSGAAAGGRASNALFRVVTAIDASRADQALVSDRPAEALALQRWWHSAPRPEQQRLHWSAATSDRPARIVLAVPDSAGQLWLGEIDPVWLWTDAFSAADEHGGCVLAARGDRLRCEGRPGAQPAQGGAAPMVSNKRLFLGNEFGADDWIFQVQRSPSAAHVQGVELGGLTVKVLLAAVLLVGILSLVQIRRTMTPLQSLVTMTRRLAQHDYDARVALTGDDEFRALGESFNDMAQRMGDQAQALTHQATHDSLTGLLNRHGLHHGLDAAITAGRPFVLIFVDLDRFKNVNDSLGHQAGDEVLRLAATRLRQTVRAEAQVARPGGDEFVVLLPDDGGVDDPGVDRITQRLCERLAEVFEVQDRELVLGASIGWARFPDDGSSAKELMRHADMAMYAAKEQGRGQARRFAPAMDAAAAQRAWVVNDLRLAIERMQFVLHYQPRVTAASGIADTAEALVRWQHPQRGLLSPALFIDIAEETGLILGLGRWVLREACRQLAQWRREGVPIERISVNLSALQLADPAVVDEVRAAIEDHGLLPSNLELEVTESLFIGDASTAAARLARLRELGIAIALDDFGTGYSSMAYLSRMPVDVIKIDRSFVKQLGEDRSADTVTRAIVSLAHSLDLRLVAEGVETTAQAEALKAMGCEQLQGYLYARPVAPADYVRLDCVRAQHAKDAAR